MNRLFFTGDKHFPAEYKLLSFKHWPLGRELDRNDYVIILGDFGIAWDRTPEEEWWLNWFEERPWTTLFIEGNHQNFPLLNAYPVEEWNDGLTHVLRPHIRHLMRGQIFDLNGFSFFCLGGAVSIDRHLRVEGRSWWPEELPSGDELRTALKSLRNHDMRVDYILTHTTSSRTVREMQKPPRHFDLVNSFLDKMVEDEVEYRMNFFGHFHQDRAIDDKHLCLYNDIIELLPNGEIKVVNK